MGRVTVRRLQPGDEAVLELLARDASDFDLADRSGPDEALTAQDARRYLANDSIRHWIAEAGDDVVGELLCHVIALPHGSGCEALLYSIGVRERWRRQGVGSALVRVMDDWMDEAGIAYVWVLADNAEAVEFYRACGFEPDPEGADAVMMSREWPIGGRWTKENS